MKLNSHPHSVSHPRAMRCEVFTPSSPATSHLSIAMSLPSIIHPPLAAAPICGSGNGVAVPFMRAYDPFADWPLEFQGKRASCLIGYRVLRNRAMWSGRKAGGAADSHKIIALTSGRLAPPRSSISLYTPAGSPANREPFAAHNSQSDPRPVPSDSRDQSENGHACTIEPSRYSVYNGVVPKCTGEGGREIPEKNPHTNGIVQHDSHLGKKKKNHRPTASSGTITTYDNPGVTRPEIEPGSPWWEASRLTAHIPCSQQQRNGSYASDGKTPVTSVHTTNMGNCWTTCDLGTHDEHGQLLDDLFYFIILPPYSSAFPLTARRPCGSQAFINSIVLQARNCGSKKERLFLFGDKIDFKRVHTKVAFEIRSDFIRHTLDDSVPIADLQGNKKRILYCQMRGNTGATANEQTSEVQLWKGLWSLAYSSGMKEQGEWEIPEKTRIRHDSHLRKSGVNRPGIEPGLPWWEATSLNAQPPWTQQRAGSPNSRDILAGDFHTRPSLPRVATGPHPKHASCRLKPMRVIEVNMERRRNEEAGETGDARENPPTNGIVRHDSHLRISGGPAGANRLATVPPPTPAGSLPDFRVWESCRMMPVVGGFSRGYPVSPNLAFRLCSFRSLPSGRKFTKELIPTDSPQRSSKICISLLFGTKLPWMCSICAASDERCEVQGSVRCGIDQLDNGGFYHSHQQNREVNMEQPRNAWAGKRDIPEKIRRLAVSSVTIHACANPEVTPPGIEPVSPWWEASSLTTIPLRPQ
ncbi:hypothetical protein PR048_030808 [Dryococelus australis]|uniref:Uncharacterized protein n=1 Tax=Dryococelus australis TaxID=614101 RepID=A0ABQ9GDU3_9NEOP|nr:hypothetical protein PR048_030808 [Dryococelus australis]